MRRIGLLLLMLLISTSAAHAASFIASIKLEKTVDIREEKKTYYIAANLKISYSMDPPEIESAQGRWGELCFTNDAGGFTCKNVTGPVGELGVSGAFKVGWITPETTEEMIHDELNELIANMYTGPIRVSRSFYGDPYQRFDFVAKIEEPLELKKQFSEGFSNANILDIDIIPMQSITQAQKDSSLDPIELSSGNMYIEASDISLPGFSAGMQFSRRYSSQDDHNGLLGFGWRSNYDISLSLEDNSNIIEWNSAGAATHYTLLDDGTYSSSIGKHSKLSKNDDGTYLITRRNGEKHYFDVGGKLSQVVDRNNNSLYLDYDPNGNLISVTDQANRKIEFTVVDNKIVEAKDPAGRTTQYTYDANDNLIKITDPAANEVHYVYDDDHNIIEMTNANANKTYYAYDDQDRAISNWQEGDVNKETVSYDSDSQTTLTDANGNQTVYEFNEYGVTTKVTYADGGTVEYIYNENMQKDAIIDAYGNRTEFVYDENKNLSQIIDAKGNVTEYTYEAIYNKITSIKDAQGNITSYDYDVSGNLVKVTDALGNITEYTYDSFGNKSSVKDANGNITSFEYDEFANLTKVIDALGNETSITYDDSGNPVTVTDAKLGQTTNAYDLLNRLKETVFTDATKVEINYDAFGNKISVKDQLERTTNFNYDLYERKIATIDALSNTVANSYDARGNLKTVTDQNANITTLSYDSSNRLIKETTALGNETTYTYDFLNRVSTKTNPDGTSVSYEYDELGNLVKKLYSDAKEVTYTYDNLNRMSSMSDWTGTTTYSYDALGRILELDGPELADTIVYEYDAVGNKTATINQDGTRTEYSYDQLNRLLTVTDEKGTTNFSYDELSNVTNLVYPNGASIEKAYDAMNRVEYIANKNGGGEIISAFTYSYNAAGMLVKKSFNNGAWIEYLYDDINRLIRETKKKTNKKGITKELYDYEYAYDGAGNRTVFAKNITVSRFWKHERPNLPDQVKADLTSAGYGKDSADLPLSFAKEYSYDADNQLNSWTRNIAVEDTLINISSHDYTYDTNGNRASKTFSKIGELNSFVTNYSYDIENRLTEIEYLNRPNENGVTNAIFDYNSNGIRTKSSEVRPAKTNTTKYYYDGLNVIIERDENDLSQKSYTRAPGYGGGIAGILSMHKYRYNEVVPETTTSEELVDEESQVEPVIEQTSKSLYYHYDALGSVSNLTNESGVSIGSYGYDAYGRKKNKTGKHAGNKYRFSTKEYEAHAALYYFGARYYDPNTGRWLTRDPMGFVDGPNVYAYVTNNPVNFVDYYGYSAQMIGGFGTKLPIPVGYNPPVLPNLPDFNSTPAQKNCSGGVEKKKKKKPTKKPSGIGQKHTNHGKPDGKGGFIEHTHGKDPRGKPFAINKDGTPHDGGGKGSPSNKQKDWLQDQGYDI